MSFKIHIYYTISFKTIFIGFFFVLVNITDKSKFLHTTVKGYETYNVFMYRSISVFKVPIAPK